VWRVRTSSIAYGFIALVHPGTRSLIAPVPGVCGVSVGLGVHVTYVELVLVGENQHDGYFVGIIDRVVYLDLHSSDSSFILSSSVLSAIRGRSPQHIFHARGVRYTLDAATGISAHLPHACQVRHWTRPKPEHQQRTRGPVHLEPALLRSVQLFTVAPGRWPTQRSCSFAAARLNCLRLGSTRCRGTATAGAGSECT
jgi:hypothetical protein